MTVFDDLERLIQIWRCGRSSGFRKFHCLVCLLMIFVSFSATFGSAFPLECYLYLSWGACAYFCS